MRIPNNKGYAGRLGRGVQTLLGSRFFVAVSALTMTAFLAHVLNAPERFPQFAVLSFQTMGILPPLPPAPDLPQVGATVKEAAHGAAQAGLPYLQAWLAEQGAKVKAYFAANPGSVVIGNYVGLVLSGAALGIGTYLLAQQRKTTAV